MFKFDDSKFKNAQTADMNDEDRMLKLKKLQEEIKKQEQDILEKKRVLYEADEDYVRIKKSLSKLNEDLKFIEKAPFVHEGQNVVSENGNYFTLTSVLKELYVGILPSNDSKTTNSTMTVFPEELDIYDIEHLVKKLMQESRIYARNKLKEKLAKIETDLESIVSE